MANDRYIQVTRKNVGQKCLEWKLDIGKTLKLLRRAEKKGTICLVPVQDKNRRDPEKVREAILNASEGKS